MSDCGRRVRWLCCAAVLAASLALYLPRLDREFAPDIASAAATYQMLFARHWDDAGFAELRGVPCVGEEWGGVLEREPYLHHPVLSYWGAYALRALFGWDEWVFRLLPCLALIAAALLTTLIALRLLSTTGALLSGALFLLSPAAYVYGDMPNPESLVLCFLLLIWLLHERVRERPALSRKLWFLVVAGLGMLLDWQVFFIVPTLLLGEMLRPRSERRWREALLLIPVALLALTATLAHFAWGIGSVERLAQELSATVDHTLGLQKAGFGAFVAAQGRALLHCMGPGLLLCGGLLLLAAITRRLRADRIRAVSAMLVPALLSVVIFRRPAFDHLFWWMPAVPFFALAAAWLMTKLLDARPLAGVAAALILFASLALTLRAGEHERDLPENWFQSVAALADRFARENDAVLTPEQFGPAQFYARVRIIENVATPAKVEYIRQHWRHGRVHVFLTQRSALAHAELVRWLDGCAKRTPHPAVLHWTL